MAGRRQSSSSDSTIHSEQDHERVRELLGREPEGRYEVIVRDAAGDPVVIRNAPLLVDGTPMPTRYWLVGREQVVAVSRLEAAGGVRAAEAAVDPAALAAAHERYALERDAQLPDDVPRRPSGGVAGTRQGVKCLHAHYAWYLAGGDDPVGRWVADQLTRHLDVVVTPDRVRIAHGGWSTELPISPSALAGGDLADHDPPNASDLTNALGAVSDHLDDVVRERPDVLDTAGIGFGGEEAWHLAVVERGTAELDAAVAIERDDLEDLFRTLATESRAQRLHNPALHPDRVDLIVATCCTVLAIMRRLQFTEATFRPSPIPSTVGLGSRR